MKKLIFLLFTICVPFSLISSELCQSGCCPTPTEYVMYFLKRSGTTWRGSTDWKNSLKDGQTVHTNYMATRDMTHVEYTGSAIRLHSFYNTMGPVPVDTVKAYFEITRTGNTVTIKSRIEDTEVRKNVNDQEAEEIQKKARIGNTTAQLQTDFCSQCKPSCTVNFDRNSRTMRMTLISECTSTIPTELFMRQI